MMGTIFMVNGLYDRAIEYIIKSKLNYEKVNFKDGHAWAAYLLGRIYADVKLPQKALKYFEEALEAYLELASIDGNKNGVAICYEQIGMLNLKSGNFKEARKNIEHVLQLYSESESKYGISNAHKNLGKIEYYMGNYERSENYLNNVLLIKKEIGDLLSQPSIYEYLGLSQIKRGRIEEGFNNIQQGLELALSNNQKKIQLEIYSKLTEAYLNLNNLKKANDCQNKQIEIQNLLLSDSASIKIEQLQAIL
jgi:tetratricopeptide (TPR) repeat protein